MSYKQLTIISILTLFLFTSCFEFVEEITFNKDGTGSAVITVNLSQSKTKLASIMLLDSVNGYKIPSKADIQNHVSKAVTKINKISGISNVKKSIDFDEFIVTISCDFKNVEAINSVLVSFSSKTEAQKIKNHKHFSFNKAKNEFVRSHHFNIGREFQKTKSQDREVFEKASYTGIYRFSTPVASCTNKQSRISKNKKAVMLRLMAQDIITNKQTIKNSIQLYN
ncbi:hypothetical protein SAMN04489761_2158 [Tenacibaculum sp. MAR_2009_124]|uniref:hypothetical protein n=1 Tax=Tenacibaculum sp. MAR_2009_124 TaxID=1250059 RepID=UPI00089A1ECA|nr:hypothetical protein [Tenacibaculum sp. MAR_2009_124]SEB98180.1 hypothetical protein SAMN04489761_2158 [Tenacibaculum sp. MAR_2009_124]